MIIIIAIVITIIISISIPFLITMFIIKYHDAYTVASLEAAQGRHGSGRRLCACACLTVHPDLARLREETSDGEDGGGRASH